MPRYFFDLSSNGETFPDPEGSELPNLESAEDEAAKTLLEIAREKLPDGTYHEASIQVRDEAGNQLVQIVLKFELSRIAGISSA